jgi:ABC-type multidrug transport system fused ATPase/permease subunit
VGGVASNAGKVASLLVGGLLVLQGAITPEQLTTFFLYVQFVTDSSHTVCDQYAVIMEAIGAGERVLGYLDDPPAPQIAPGKVPDSFSGRLELRNVSFR